MGTFRNVSKAEACPICGKSDWCSILIPDNAAYPGQLLYVCRRIHSPEAQSPVNGKTYYYIKELPDSSCLYSDIEKRGRVSEKSFGYTYRPAQEAPAPPADYGTIPLPNNDLDLIYTDFMNLLCLSKKHYAGLRSERWPKDLIRDSFIRSLSFPRKFDSVKGFYSDHVERHRICQLLLKKHKTLKGVPGFYQEADLQWTFTGHPGMLIPIYDTDGMLYRIRLRLDHPGKDEKGKEKDKYKNFSSFYPSKDSNNILSNEYLNGCRAGSHIGFYFHPSTDDPGVCYITEGEKKAIVANYFLRCIVISLPGVNSHAKLTKTDKSGRSVLDFLKTLGCKSAVVAYDADKNVNEHVHRHEKKLVALLKNHSFHTYIGSWNPGFGKGLDDILVLGVKPQVFPV